MTKKVVFEAIDENGVADGSNGWRVLVDGQEVIPRIRDTDIANGYFDPLWETIGVDLVFDWD